MVYYSPPPVAPQQKPRKSNWALIIVGIFVASLFLNFVTSSPSSSEDTEPVASNEQSTAPIEEAEPDAQIEEPAAQAVVEQTTFAVGQPVTTKKFEYVITGYECGIPSVGEHEITREIAKGHFCRISITAKNIATKAKSLNFSDFKLMSGEIEYSTESWTNITASTGTDSSGFLDKINPGLQVSGNIYFDVPTDVVPDSATIDDTFFSKPATIKLT